MENTDELIALAVQNEAKTIYDMHKAACDCNDGTDCGCTDTWETVTFAGGGSARAELVGKTLTLYYTDGLVSTYTEK